MNRTPVVIVLAAGRGERFMASGGKTHKLQALLQGKPVLQHTLDAVHASGLPLVVVHSMAGQMGGMADSIARGVAAAPDAPGWLVLPGDLPLIQAATLVHVATALQTASVVVPYCQGLRGHPVGFAAVCRSALESLAIDFVQTKDAGAGESTHATTVDAAVAAPSKVGAAAVVRRFGETPIEVDDCGIYQDIDTLQDLERAQAHLQLNPNR